MADLATAFVGASAGVSCVSRSHGKFGGGAHRYVSGLPSVSWQIRRRRSSGRRRAFPAFHGLMANSAAALIGTLAGCRAFHGRFGGGVHRYVSGLPSVSWQIWRRRSSGRRRAFPAFHGLMANSAAALIGTLAGCRAFHGRVGDGYETRPLGCWTERALPSPFTKTFSRAISVTFSDRPHHFVTVSGRSSREHCVRDARGGACPCHVGSFPFPGLRSVY